MNFEKGNPQRPRGHALLYFRSRTDSTRILATYIVVPPIALNLSKYVPPFLAGQLGQLDFGGMSAFPLPPIPEHVESYEFLSSLAEARADDLLFGGTADESAIERLLADCTEAASQYYSLYTSFTTSLAPTTPLVVGPPLRVPRAEYQAMGEIDKLGELSRITGKLRDAVSRGEKRLVEETVQEILELAETLPEKYKVGRLTQVATIPGEKGRRLSELYIDRCYKLYYEEYEKIEAIQEQIHQLEAASQDQ
ncbi:MAG: hypothetical protein M1358_23650 [Chloroflexi bacterium]|nr:hypothetical protein [Chloroflexota bacterium]